METLKRVFRRRKIKKMEIDKVAFDIQFAGPQALFHVLLLQCFLKIMSKNRAKMNARAAAPKIDRRVASELSRTPPKKLDFSDFEIFKNREKCTKKRCCAFPMFHMF